MLSHNEWDQLISVIVGRADGAQLPEVDISARCILYAHLQDTQDVYTGTFPAQVIEEANQDLEKLVEFLQSLAITVYRPALGHDPGYYNYCPRDSVLVHDNLLMVTPQPLRARQHDWFSLQATLSDMATQYAAEILVKPARLSDSLYNLSCVGDTHTLGINNHEPAFDAANCLRANNDIFYLVSNTGNLAGCEYLQSVVPESVRVWPIQGVYSYSHIDSTIALLREGLMLLNPERIHSLDQLPLPLRNWDVIWAPEPVEIGHWPGLCNASKWIGMNLLSVSPDLVVLEEHQHNLRIMLESHGIECAMLPCRHQRTLSGGFHCVTLDLERAH